MTIKRDTFVARLELALDRLREKRGPPNGCLGCLLSDCGLFGGEVKARAMPHHHYYVTGTKYSHQYMWRSTRWLRRVVQASIARARCSR